VLTLVAVLASGALAAKPGSAASGQSYSDANAASPRASSAMTANEQVLKKASHVMHAKVKSPDGKTLGQIDDLVLTSDLHGISYVAVSSGDVLGMGGNLHAVPWDSLSQGVNDAYVIPISEQQFKQSKGFNSKSWPSSAEIGWTRQGEEPVYQGQVAAKDVRNRRFTRIKGTDAKGTDGKKIGDIHDLVIVMDTGRIAYDVISYGGVLGFGQRLTAVPESAVTLEPAMRVARIEATPATLHANSFSPGQWPDLSSPSYSRQLARAFSVPPSGTALGYLPAEGGAVAAAPAPRTPARPSARSTTPPVSGALPSAAAAPTAAELTGTFNPASVTSIEGTVAEEGKFQPTSSAPEMLWLRVRTSNGPTVLVNLGPRSYISSQDFYVVPGDQIHLRGSEVTATASGKRVFLPTEVKYGDQTLKLRSETGAGLWEGQATTPGASQPGTTSPSSTSQPQSRAGGPGTALGYTPAEEQATTGAAGQSMTPSRQMTTPGADNLRGTTARAAQEPNEPNKPTEPNKP
jgi:sporulation protein YlmC with PRC-barrel domain